MKYKAYLALSRKSKRISPGLTHTNRPPREPGAIQSRAPGANPRLFPSPGFYPLIRQIDEPQLGQRPEWASLRQRWTALPRLGPFLNHLAMSGNRMIRPARFSRRDAIGDVLRPNVA